MKKVAFKAFAVMISLIIVIPACAQFDIKKAVGGVVKAVRAFTPTDEQMAEYVKESTDWMNEHNPALPEDDPYVQRFGRLTKDITDADGTPLNSKVYHVTDINIFTRPDGSVRVFSPLVDITNDDELLGIIGHGTGHALKRHSKNVFKNELLTGALKDVAASTSDGAAALTESQLGSLGQSLMNAEFSQQQESEADGCGYDLLVAQGRSPRDIVMPFEKLVNLEGNSGSKQSYIQKMFSSHPETQRRIEHMQRCCEEDGIVRPATQMMKKNDAIIFFPIQYLCLSDDAYQQRI